MTGALENAAVTCNPKIARVEGGDDASLVRYCLGSLLRSPITLSNIVSGGNSFRSELKCPIIGVTTFRS